MAVRLVLTVAVFAYVLRDFDAAAARNALTGFAFPSVAAILALIAADRALMLGRWGLLMRATSDLSWARVSRIFMVSSFVGSFLPAGVGGDAARAVSVSRETQQTGPAVASVIVDRLLGLLAVAISGCVGVAVANTTAFGALRIVTLAASVALLFVCVAALNADRLASHLLPSAWRSTTVGRLALTLSSALAAYRQHSSVLWRVAVLSLMVQAVRIVLAWVIGRGLGITLPFDYYLVFMPINILIILIPVSLGGFGVPQGAMVWSLSPLGVSATQGVLLSTLFVLAGTIGSLPGALLFIAGDRSRRPSKSRS